MDKYPKDEFQGPMHLITSVRKVLTQRNVFSRAMAHFSQELINKIIIQQGELFYLTESYRKDQILSKDNTAFQYPEKLWIQPGKELLGDHSAKQPNAAIRKAASARW